MPTLSPIRRLILLVAASVCGGCDINFFLCEPADPAVLAELPATLSETGIDEAAVYEYVPQFELWSDAAEKRRFFALPAGERIDTSNPDDWQFPIGTKVWKEFARDGVKLETRLLLRLGSGVRDWASVSYVWNDEQTSAAIEPLGRLGAGGTSHNVPAAGECAGCHAGRSSWVLGVSAVQLSHTDGNSETVELGDLMALDLVSDPVAEVAVPGGDTERQALGYLHANCGHCHNGERPPRDGKRCFEPKNGLDLWLRTNRGEALAETNAVATSLDLEVVVPGQPSASDLIERVDRRGFIYQMPPIGSEEIDAEALSVLRRWVSEL